MHVAIITHNVFPGDGQGRVNYELARYCLMRGATVTLFCDKLDLTLREMGASWVPLHTGLLGEAVDLYKVWRFRQKVDRVIATMDHMFDVILGCGVVMRFPHTINAVHFVHGTWMRSPYHPAQQHRDWRARYQGLFTRLNAAWELETFAQAQCIVAVSDMVRDELMAIGVPPERIEVIVNGVDLEEFHPGRADRTRLGLPEGVPLALFVGDIRSPIKNLDGVLHALQQVPGLHVAVAGKLPGSPYPALAEQLGVADRVHFLGFRRDIASLMRAVDFFVLPSRRDSCPLVLLEAMASGLPVVVSRQVGTANLVGQAGFVIDSPEDHEALAQAMGALARDPDLRQQMGLAARAVAEQHSWDQMANQYAALFERLTGKTFPLPALYAV
ncbi:glycosyltransferase family 4 protein [Rhodothermus bifroesti]|mgnify:CR=1 FL=1|jgi:glycosyltransferase involved in cell wall biosynthesis|uniref:Glycosyltransferase family 1 protein n=1 Tax=Rhodothermus marinus TaxID=29549 RepID=A0A7V2F6R3_RHOMR|nr:glycosyltransferase family 4 protein [Rhodothermus bifroesti]GBD01951.1 D-inositol 3-phosphate glycosyltransferase [bacterium HR18]